MKFWEERRFFKLFYFTVTALNWNMNILSLLGFFLSIKTRVLGKVLVCASPLSISDTARKVADFIPVLFHIACFSACNTLGLVLQLRWYRALLPFNSQSWNSWNITEGSKSEILVTLGSRDDSGIISSELHPKE